MLIALKVGDHEVDAIRDAWGFRDYVLGGLADRKRALGFDRFNRLEMSKSVDYMARETIYVAHGDAYTPAGWVGGC